MQNFQNELQMLGMDQYQVGQLTPIDYQGQYPLEFGEMRRCGCGGCGFRCGGCGFRCGGCFRCGGFGCFGFGLGCFGFFI